MPSLTDVAHAAGVSLTTASMVLNKGKQHNRVSAACASRVQEAARRLGYVPNYHARSMKLGRAEVLAVAMDFSVADLTASAGATSRAASDAPATLSGDEGLDSSSSAARSHQPTIDTDAFRLARLGQLLAGIEHCTRSHGYVITVVGSAHDMPAPQRAILGVRQRRFDGIVVPAMLLPDAQTDFLTEPLDVPVVVVHPIGLTLHPAVVFDERAAVSLAVSHLRELGHRHVAFAWQDDLQGNSPGLPHDRLARLRAEHFQAACSAAGVAAQLVAIPSGGSPGEAAHALRSQIRLSGQSVSASGAVAGAPLTTGLVAADESAARRLLDAAANISLRVPHDVSVVALGDALGETTSPHLTCVSQMLFDLGARAAELCIDMACDPTAVGRLKGTRTVVAPELHIRQSTAPAAAD